jgi:hypothetical protein
MNAVAQRVGVNNLLNWLRCAGFGLIARGRAREHEFAQN